MGSGQYLIVGLGNPGKQYETTRHNVGFWGVDYFQKERGSKASWDSSGNALICNFKKGPKSITLMKPQTFMNLSGEAVKYYLKNNDVPHQNILIIYDDIDIPVGKVRFRPKGSAGTHNGLTSIIECLETENIPRLRIGVGPYDGKQDLSDFVLDPFSVEQSELIKKVTEVETLKMLTTWMHQGINKAQNEYNGIDFGAPIIQPEESPEKPEKAPSPL